MEEPQKTLSGDYNREVTMLEERSQMHEQNAIMYEQQVQHMSARKILQDINEDETETSQNSLMTLTRTKSLAVKERQLAVQDKQLAESARQLTNKMDTYNQNDMSFGNRQKQLHGMNQQSMSYQSNSVSQKQLETPEDRLFIEGHGQLRPGVGEALLDANNPRHREVWADMRQYQQSQEEMNQESNLHTPEEKLFGKNRLGLGLRPEVSDAMWDINNPKHREVWDTIHQYEEQQKSKEQEHTDPFAFHQPQTSTMSVKEEPDNGLMEYEMPEPLKIEKQSFMLEQQDTEQVKIEGECYKSLQK